MVDRCLTGAPGKMLAVDLDGTYFKVNSLHSYARFGFIRLMRKGRVARAMRVLSLMLLRRVKAISHRRMKWGMLQAIGFDEATLDQYAVMMRRVINSRVNRLMTDFAAEGGTVLIATAAAAGYVRAIAPFDYVATEIEGNPAMTECRGEEKLRRVMEYARDRGLELWAVATDHPDDMPLLRACAGMKVIVGADSAFRAALLDEFDESELMFID